MTAAIDLSLIIPMGPQETQAPRLLQSKFRLPERWEGLVSAGPDPLLPSFDPWTTVRGESGRGRQLNRAAREARGQYLWFVHADSLPDAQALESMQTFISATGTTTGRAAIGYFTLRFDADGPALTQLNAFGANLRSRFLRLPYGDQSYVVRSVDFQALGGFREDLERGEDLDFIVRARRAGMPIRPMPGTLVTSARRYRDHGWLKTTLSHQLAAYRLIKNAKQAGQKQ